MNPDAIRYACWRDGDLEALLHNGTTDPAHGQRGILKRFAASTARRFIIECARRWGKSWFACVLALMFAIQRPGAQIRYCAPTQKMVRTIVVPLMREILENCPEPLRPSWNVQDGIWRFPNGSEIHVVGVDNQGADRARGTSTDLAIIDEAGFVDDLSYLVQSVLLPQLLTVDGRMLLISTPATTPDHSFTDYCEEASSTDAYAHATIYDAPHITGAQIEELADDLGGVDSIAFRREALAERVVDQALVVVPEFAPRESSIVLDTPREPYVTTWVSGDIGFVDLAAFIFARVDFRRARIVVEDEVDLQRTKSTDINVACARKERELWGTTAPNLRVIDAAAITVADMDERVNVKTGERAKTDEKGPDVHVMHWVLAQKDEADAALNELRLAVSDGRLEIHPRCATLRKHLRHGIWNKKRKAFERIERDGERHHFDYIDAAKYLVRHVNMRLNPYPLLPPGVSPDTHHIPPQKRQMSALFRGSRR